MTAEADFSASDAPKNDARSLAIWTGETGKDAFAAALGAFSALSDKIRPYLTHVLAATVVLGCGLAAASLATAPALTDGLDEVAAIDARQMGLAVNLDAGGQQKKTASLGRDVSAMRNEITRLQKALDQSKANQASLKSSATQAAASFDEVKSLKADLAALQKTLDTTRGDAATKLSALEAKVEQSKQDDAKVAELKDRLEKLEKVQTVKRDDPETTGSLGAKNAPPPPPAGPVVVKDWTVRDVYDGVALLEGRRGMIEVERGARAPGIGRITSIQKRDGEWVVVTDKGVILSR